MFLIFPDYISWRSDATKVCSSRLVEVSLFSYSVLFVTKPSKQGLITRASVINGKVLLLKAAHPCSSFERQHLTAISSWESFSFIISHAFIISHFYMCIVLSFISHRFIIKYWFQSHFPRFTHICNLLNTHEQNVFKIIITAIYRSIIFIKYTMQWMVYVISHFFLT